MKGIMMISPHIRIGQARGALLISAVLALGAGCQAEYSGGGGVYAQAPSGGEAAIAVAPAPVEVDADLVYDAEPPVDDIEEYPSVVYGGVTVYFVGGRWYRRGPRGWAYFRNEPPELGRQREMHDRDPRWAQARERPTRPGVAEPQAPERAQAPGAPAPPDTRAEENKKEEEKKADTKAPPGRRPPPKKAPRRAPPSEEHR